MRWHSFLNKLAFICNVLFFVCVAIRFVGISNNAMQHYKAYIIILGMVVAFPLNIILLLVHLALRIKGKFVAPKWLLYTNMAIFIFQVLYFLL